MELRDIEYFVNIAKLGKLHRAAAVLGVTQPALTKAIHRIENELGAQLFIREPRGVTLTPVGDIFMRHVNRVRITVEQAKREISEFTDATGGHLSIGVAPAVSDTWLPKVCLSLLEEAPQATLRIFTAMNDSLLPAVHSGEIDLAISGIASHPPAELAQEVLASEDFFPVVGFRHPLFNKRSKVTLKQLAELRWILSPSNALTLSRQALIRHFSEHGLPPPHAVIETNSVVTMLACVGKSDLAGFVPSSVLGLHGERVATLNPRAPLWRRTIGVTYRAHAYIPPLAYRLIRTLRKVIGESA